ncbi:MAG: hypothetical protein IPK28_01295 [Devosia sp.]|nr:hypothetical protein [Devosia sp.]
MLGILDRLVLAAANLGAGLAHPWLALSFAWRRRRWPCFATPSGLSELVQWRKVFDRNPLFPVLSDKLRLKTWVHERAPEARVAEIVWSGTRAADLPDRFLVPGYVIKANHGTSANYFPHRETLPRAGLESRLEGWLRSRYDAELQWAYGRIPPRLMVERLIGDGRPLWEMTFRCADGVAATAFVVLGQKTQHERKAYFTGSGDRLPDEVGLPPAQCLPPDYRTGPEFGRARALAEKLSRGFDFVRVDLILDGDDIYVCEMTFYPSSGFGDEDRTFTAERIERAWLGAIARSWFLSSPQPWPLSLYAAAFRRWAAARLQSRVRAIPMSAERTEP